MISIRTIGTSQSLAPWPRNRSRDLAVAGESLAPVPSASLIVAAYVLAQDIVSGADSNYNGTLSKSEIAALSPSAAMSSDALDGNRDGQISVGEMAHAMLDGITVFS